MRGDDLFRQMATQAPFNKLHPQVAAFFKNYLAHEKAVRFNGRYVINTHFPPYPSRAFANLAENFNAVGCAEERRLFSVTLAVTNRCRYHCWHCYNAGRSQVDLPLPVLKQTLAALQEMSVVQVTLSGGEPLLRPDLEEIVASFDARTCLNLNTTGAGLTAERARALRENGLFSIGISLDSPDPAEHDRMRGRQGAFETALQGLQLASEAGLYPYVVTVASSRLLEPDPFFEFLRFVQKAGGREVHLLEPCATGSLQGNTDALLSDRDRQRILDYQETAASDESLPILSSFLYLEGEEAFGCGAGLTHLYLDGSGEVCPCNLVPLSFGNVNRESLSTILERMGTVFKRPRTGCIGHILAPHIPEGPMPLPPETSLSLCREYLPEKHPLPRFFQIRAEAHDSVGRDELRAAYDTVFSDYDAFWLSEAAGPIEDLVRELDGLETARILEAGCGTGYATALLAARLSRQGQLLAVDLSENMQKIARQRLLSKGLSGVEFIHGDALEVLRTQGPLDLVFSSWVLGYIPLVPFFAAAQAALTSGGRLAFVVHKENSPREPLELFGELVAEDPSVLSRQVAFDFPRDAAHIRELLGRTDLEVQRTWEGSITFRYDNPAGVLEHLLKSGAGTAFYEAVDPARRPELEQAFLERLARRHPNASSYAVTHDYVTCLARKR